MRQTLLMCSPEGFGVEYEINPWMRGQVGQIDRPLAMAQWLALHKKLSALAEVEVMAGDPAWPDLVFTANAGLLIWQDASDKVMVLASFRHPQRQGEQAINRAWFEAQGWRCVVLNAGVCFEGAGDALMDGDGRLFVADGPRTDRVAATLLSEHVAGPVHALRLVDPAYYHLDTCFCPLADGYALYLPFAFDVEGQRLLRSCFGERLIALTAEEGRLFCANAVNVDRTVVMNTVTPRLSGLLADAGLTVITTPLTEFMKSGGSAKCLTLRIG